MVTSSFMFLSVRYNEKLADWLVPMEEIYQKLASG
jgi:hypothetical protein